MGALITTRCATELAKIEKKNVYGAYGRPRLESKSRRKRKNATAAEKRKTCTINALGKNFSLSISEYNCRFAETWRGVDVDDVDIARVHAARTYYN